MASKHLQAKKQRLLSVLEAKRYQISESAERLQSSASSQEVGKPNMKIVSKKRGKVTSSLKLAKDFIGKRRKKSQQLSKFKGSTPKINAPLKPILIGSGALFIVGALIGQSKKKRRKKELALKEAKAGFGMVIFKWLLSAFLPAAKHVVTQVIKNKVR